MKKSGKIFFSAGKRLNKGFTENTDAIFSMGNFVAASKQKPAETEKPAAINSDSGSDKPSEVVLPNEESGQPENQILH